MDEPKSETQKCMEHFYAKYREDGYTHEQAMAKINAAMEEAIPQAVRTIMDEIRAGRPNEPPPMCAACNGFGYVGPAKCHVCAGRGRVSLSPSREQ